MLKKAYAAAALGLLVLASVTTASAQTRPENPPGMRPENPPGARPENPPGARPENPPGARPENPPGARPENPPGARPETRPAPVRKILRARSEIERRAVGILMSTPPWLSDDGHAAGAIRPHSFWRGVNPLSHVNGIA
jgi:hypothetical protein